MRNNYIYKYMYFLVCTVLMFSSCAEEEFIDTAVDKEGKPVTVSLKVTEPGELLQARALTAGQERHMDDLYILIFDADGKRKFGKYYVVPSDVTKHQEATIPTNGTIDDIETTSGESYIYGIANVVENELEDLKATLDGVDTIDELFAIKATLATSGNIERNQASLLMSGAYVGGGNGGKYAGYCNIPEPAEAGGDVSLTGKIDLVRVDSRIAFNITPSGKNIETFELKSWRVYNVPDVTYLMSQAEDAAKDDDDYVDSKSNLNFQLENSTYTFEFYMLENRKKAKEYEGTAIQTYADREKEVKESLTDDETDLPGQTERNTGVYKYVEPNAAYVEFEVEMTLKVPDNNSKRVANARYVVHLGGVKGNDDFNSERNYKYNYNIEIIDVDDIIVEVENDGQEPRPGAEGSVVDAQQRVFQLDAHYHTFIIEVTKNRMKPFNFQVVTPFTTYTQNDTGIEGEDLTWIQFKRNTDNSATRLEYYGDSLLSLFELSKDVANQITKSNDDVLYYTVFVKEYYYDKAPDGQTWETPYWRYFVNQPNRYAMLMFSPKYSDDGDSNYSDAVYLISQKSIQTYYSTENLNSGKNALGVEHTDEKQITGSLSWNGNGELSDVNGYSNTYNYVQGDAYSRYFTQNGDYLTWNEKWHVPNTKTSYVLAQCISRNRDEDGNGRIDGNEVKWYVPTDKQLTEIYLGAASLPSPLFDSRLIASISSNQSQYHIAASNNRRIWAEEGCSTSNFSDLGSGNVSNIRCVRNLGDATNNLVAPVYTSTKEDNKVKYISVPYLREENIRTGIIDSGDLRYHDNFSETNLPYYHFEVAENFHTDDVTWGARTNVENYLKDVNDSAKKSICASYSQENDGSDEGEWRMPNQRELLLMYLQGLDVVYHKSGYRSGGVASSTYWKYDVNRHFQFGVRDGVEYLFLNNANWYGDAGAWQTDGYRGYPVVRCVRDVKSVPAQ